MFRLLIILMLTLPWCSCATSSSTSEVPITGRWEGTLAHQGAELHILVDFSNDADGLHATISAPDEQMFGFTFRDVRYHPPSIHIEKGGNENTVSFDGVLSGDTISGTVEGGGLTSQVSLVRQGELPPLPYKEADVHFNNGQVSLNGTFLLPRTPAPHPAVVLIHGSHGPKRDDLRVAADIFARHGLAALIYDKRDVGNDQSKPHLYDFRDLAGDALAAVELLKTRSDINHQQIGLWSISEGGWVAPIAAAQSKDEAFVITVSGPGVTYAEVNSFVDMGRLRAAGFSEEEVAEAGVALKRVDDYVRHGGQSASLQSFLDETSRKRWAAQTTLPQRVPTVEEMKTWVRWRNLDLDPVNYWEQVRVPVLAIYGSLDYHPVEKSVERIKSALLKAENPDVTIKIFAGADHELFLPMGSRPDTHGKWDWPRPAPGFQAMTLYWSSAHVQVPH